MLGSGKALNSFLWRGDNSKTKGWNLVAWKTICKPKGCDGLGIRSLQSMNFAMLGKLGWSLVNESEKPWVQAVKAKYFLDSTFMRCRKKKICSNLWPAVLNTRNTLQKRSLLQSWSW